MLARAPRGAVRPTAAPGATGGRSDERPPRRPWPRRGVARGCARAAGGHRAASRRHPLHSRAERTHVHAVAPGGDAVPGDHLQARAPVRLRRRHGSTLRGTAREPADGGPERNGQLHLRELRADLPLRLPVPRVVFGRGDVCEHDAGCRPRRATGRAVAGRASGRPAPPPPRRPRTRPPPPPSSNPPPPGRLPTPPPPRNPHTTPTL